jgi:mono/diheme cytochrome c family protein
MRVRSFLGVLLLTASPSAFAQGNEAGKAIYEKNCAQCHGDTGDGKGPGASHLDPKPRDFTTGKFKIRTTPSGALPTDEDLKNIIRRGMPYTSMPGWAFTEPDLASLVAYLKTFHADFTDASRAPKADTFPQAPAFSKDSADKGAAAYASLGCARCHGDNGRGDGPSALTLKDDAGHSIRAANLSQRWTFRGGPTREDIFRTLSTGLNGTPMPSFRDALKPEERWQLTDFIASLSPDETPRYGTLVTAAAVDEEIDTQKAAALFAKAPPVRFPVVGQIMEPGRAFHPAVNSVVVRAIYDQQKVAFMVSWDDTRADQTGKNAPDLAVPAAEEDDAGPAPAPSPAAGDDPFAGETVEPAPAEAPAGDVWGEGDPAAAAGPAGSEFSDAVAIQLPAQALAGFTKPYFLFGDGANPVDLWFLDLAGGANRVRQLVGRGSTSLTALEASEVEGSATFDKGTWSAVFVRDLRSTTGISFNEDQFVPIAFSIWDGTARERGNRRGLTQWFYVYLPPRERPSPIGPMVTAGAGVLVLELLVVFGMRRRRKRAGVVAV